MPCKCNLATCKLNLLYGQNAKADTAYQASNIVNATVHILLSHELMAHFISSITTGSHTRTPK